MRIDLPTQLYRVGGRISIAYGKQTTRIQFPILSDGLGNSLSDPRVAWDKNGWKGEAVAGVHQQKFFSVPSVEQDAEEIVVELR